jgi:transposase
MNPTYDQLLEENRQLKACIAALEALVLDLQERLKLNSKNSSKPPSTDQKGSNEVPKKKGGAKPGHPGYFRALFPEPEVDKFVDMRAEQCPTCGEAVQPTGEAPSLHQQVEIASLEVRGRVKTFCRANSSV